MTWISRLGPTWTVVVDDVDSGVDAPLDVSNASVPMRSLPWMPDTPLPVDGVPSRS